MQVDGKVLSDSFDDLHTKFLLLGQNAKKIIVTVRTFPSDLPYVPRIAQWLPHTKAASGTL